MKKWEVARYLIDAKKDVDTILFIDRYREKLSETDKKKAIHNSRQEFYINLTAIIDEYCKQTKQDKKVLLNSNSVLKRIKYDRNKHEAHKDEEFLPRKYGDLSDMCSDMIKEIQEVKLVCLDILPENITLDFIPFDSTLFRLVYGVTFDKEKEMKYLRFPGYVLPNDLEKSGFFTDNNLSFFEDTEDIYRLSETEKKEKVVLMEFGLNMVETLQKRQDACIRMNVLMNTDTWCYIKKKDMEVIETFLILYEQGVLEVNDIPKNFSKENVKKANEALEKHFKNKKE